MPVDEHDLYEVKTQPFPNTVQQPQAAQSKSNYQKQKGPSLGEIWSGIYLNCKQLGKKILVLSLYSLVVLAVFSAGWWGRGALDRPTFSAKDFALLPEDAATELSEITIMCRPQSGLKKHCVDSWNSRQSVNVAYAFQSKAENH
jgi:hypothetical protein